MTEKFPTPNGIENSPENPKEKIPAPEEIESIFKEFLQGKEYALRRKLEDENGPTLWEISIEGENGGTIEFCYTRKKAHLEGGSTEITIDKTYYDETGYPEGGDNVARYKDGEWKIFSEENEPEQSTPIPETSYNTIKREKYKDLPLRLAKESEATTESGQLECSPYIKEVEKIIAPLLTEKLLEILSDLKTEEEAKKSNLRESFKVELEAILQYLNFLKNKTNISDSEHDSLHEKYRKISIAVGRSHGKPGEGIILHD